MELVTPDFGLFFWMLITFFIVMLILKRFAWKPILQALKQREMFINESLTSAKEAREEFEQLKKDNQKIIEKTKLERDTLLKDAKHSAQDIIDEAKDKASKEADKLIEQARKNIENQKIDALNQIRTQIAELSVEIAEKLIKKELSEDKEQEKLVNSMLKDFKLN